METPAPAQVSATAPATSTPAAPAAAPTPATALAAVTPTTPQTVTDIDAALEANFNANPNETVPLPNETVPLPNETPAPAAPAPVTPPAKPAAPVSTEPAPAVTATPTTEPATEVQTDDQGKILPRHIPTSQFDAVTQRAMVLSKALNEGKLPGDEGFIPLKDCIATIEANDAPPEPVAAETKPNIAEIASQQVTAAETKVSEIQERMKEYQANPTLYADELEAAREELGDAKVDLKLAKRDEQQAKTEVKTKQVDSVRNAMHAAILAAERTYPLLADRQGPLRARANAITLQLQNESHPNHGLVGLPSGPTFIADMAANQLAEEIAATGRMTFEQALASFRAKPAAAPAVPAAAATETEPRRVLPGTGSPTPVVAPTTVDDKLADIGEDWKKAEEFLDGGREPVYAIK